MLDFAALNARIAGPDEAARKRSFDTWNAVAKPIGSLGVLEDDVMRIAALTGSEDVRIGKRAVVVMCADNGVVAEGVSQCGREVTRLIAENVARNASSVCKMASVAHADTFAIDVGMAAASRERGVIDRAVARGTGNIACGPAMSAEEACRAVQAGIDAVRSLKERSYSIVCTGEMGIGNTTTSSAIVSVLLGIPVQEVTGRGAGLSSEGLRNKVAVIERAIRVNRPDPDDPLDVLAKVGGFDIAALAGAFIGGALYRMPMVIDGFISSVSALVAARLCPVCTCCMIASHTSGEPAARMLLDRIGLVPAIEAGMRLGEGTGAVALLPLLDMALALYRGTTFAETGMDAYEVDLG